MMIQPEEEENPDVEVEPLRPCPLSLAARTGDCEAVSRLLREGQRADDFDDRGWTPLHEAVAAGHVACAVLLLRHDGDIKDLVTFEGETPLFLSVNPKYNLDVMKILLNHLPDVNLGNNEQLTPLHKACELNLLSCAELLLESGAVVNARNNTDSRPIHEAIKRRSMEMIDLLLRYDVDLAARDSDGHTPLMSAASIGFHEVLRKLDQPGLNIVNISQYGDVVGDTALMLAVRGGCLKTTQVLLEMGADANIVRDRSQQTALHMAALGADPRLVECLVRVTDVGKMAPLRNPIICAIQSMQKMLERQSEQPGEDYRVMGPVSYLLYHKAQQSEVLTVLELLLKYGYSANVTNATEFPPLTAIAASKAPKAVKKKAIQILLDNGADADHPFPWQSIKYPHSFLPATWYYALRRHPGEAWLMRLLMAASRKGNPDTLLSVVYVYAFYNGLLEGEELYASKPTIQYALDLALELGISDNTKMFGIWSKFRRRVFSFGCLNGPENEQPETRGLVVPELLTPTSLSKLCRIVVRRLYRMSDLKKFSLPSIVFDFLNYEF